MISSIWILIPFLRSEQTSSPTTLSYLSNQNLYLGSHKGDSQLLQISSSPVSTQEVPSISIPQEIRTCSSGSLSASSPRKGKEKDLLQNNDMDVDDPIGGNFSKGRVVEAMGSFITVLDSYKNIAPIMDAILVDTDGTDEVTSFLFLFFLPCDDLLYKDANCNVFWRRKHWVRKRCPKWCSVRGAGSCTRVNRYCEYLGRSIQV